MGTVLACLTKIRGMHIGIKEDRAVLLDEWRLRALGLEAVQGSLIEAFYTEVANCWRLTEKLLNS